MPCPAGPPCLHVLWLRASLFVTQTLAEQPGEMARLGKVAVQVGAIRNLRPVAAALGALATAGGGENLVALAHIAEVLERACDTIPEACGGRTHRSE